MDASIDLDLPGGIQDIATDDALAAFERLVLGGAGGQRFVAHVAWEDYALQFPPDEEPALLREVVAEARRTAAARRLVAAETTSASASNGKTEVVRRLEAAAPAERMPLLVGFITARTLKVLGLEPTYPLETRKPLSELGLDSLMAIELKNALDTAVGRRLPTTLVFEHPTIQALSRHLIESVLGLTTKLTEARPAERRVAATASRAGEPLSAQVIAAMSEEEVEAALIQKLLDLDE
jgi:polyketide synthase 12/myxalamid-type polyketide synthase MxaB